MKHVKLLKNPSAQFKATIMDFHISYEKSAPLKSQIHVIQKKLEKTQSCAIYLSWDILASINFAYFFGVFLGCHGNQVIFFMFLQLTMM